MLENLERLLNVNNVDQTLKTLIKQLKQKKYIYKQSNRQYLYVDFKVFFVMAVSIDERSGQTFS